MCQPGRPAPQGESQAGSPGLGAFPQDEVQRVTLGFVHVDARTRPKVRKLFSGEFPVVLELCDCVEHIAARPDVGEAAFHEAVDHVDDLGQVVGRAGLVIRLLNAERVKILVHRRNEACGQRLIGLVPLARAIDDLVVDVRDIPHIGHPVAGGAEPPPHDVEGDLRARMANVDVVVDRNAADVHPHVAGFERHERFLAARQRIVDAKHDLRLHAPWTRPRAARGPAPAGSPRGAQQARVRRGGPSARTGAACRAPLPCGRCAT